MGSSTRARDFTAFDESNFPGMLVPEHFNNNQDAGDGFPGLQGAIRNWATWWLHSGNMDSGLHIAGYDITGANLVYADKIFNNSDLTGTATSTISGYGLTSGATGIFTYLTGTNGLITTAKITTSNITTANITTANITNAVITNATQDINFGSSYDLNNVAVAGIATANIGTANITTANITNAVITNATQDINFGSTYDLKNVAQYTGSTMKLAAGGLTVGTHTPSNTEWGYVNGMQAVSTSSSPTFANIKVTTDIMHTSDENNEITFGTDTQTFKVAGGTELDISNAGVRIGGAGVRVAQVTNSDALGTSDTILCTQGNVKAYTDNLLAIGSANKRWINMTYLGANPEGYELMTHSIGGTIDLDHLFEIPLPYIIGTHNLRITNIKIGLANAGGINYLSARTLYGWTDFDSYTTMEHNTDNFDTPQEIIWNIADVTIGGVYERVVARMQSAVDVAIEFSYVQVEYYYT